MKVIIAGSRNYVPKTTTEFESYIQRCSMSLGGQGFEISEVVCGMCPGVDLLARAWGFYNKIPVKEFPADWKTHGKKAGAIRNIEMAKYADALILIWDGKSKGSDLMRSIAKLHNLIIRELIYTNEEEHSTTEQS